MLAWKFVAEREQFIFDKCIECIPVDAPRIDLTCDVAIHCHCREDAEVGALLEMNWVGNNLTFWPPPMCSFPRTSIDPGFIKKNHLLRAPLCNFSNPSIPEFLISLSSFFRKLRLAYKSLEAPCDLCILDP